MGAALSGYGERVTLRRRGTADVGGPGRRRGGGLAGENDVDSSSAPFAVTTTVSGAVPEPVRLGRGDARKRQQGETGEQAGGDTRGGGQSVRSVGRQSQDEDLGYVVHTKTGPWVGPVSHWLPAG